MATNVTGGPSLTAADIAANAQTLAPTIEVRAQETAAARRLPPETVKLLKAAGVFRMPWPRSWHGPEMTPREQTQIIEILSRADPSVGWCIMIGIMGGYLSAFLEDSVAHELWSDLDTVTAGYTSPAGRARRVSGGYLVDGRWPFGSGCTHADIIIAGCTVFDDDDNKVIGPDDLPATCVVAAPAHEWEILDTWCTTGLAGTGSHDYRASGLWVPTEHTFSMWGESRRPGPLYAFRGMYFASMPGVALGLARRAIDEVLAILPEKVSRPEGVPMSQLPRVRAAVAQAEAAFGAARAYVYETLDRVWDELQQVDSLSTAARVQLSLSRINAFHAAREIAQLMVDTAGTQAIYSASPLDGLLRDAITLNQHVGVHKRLLESVGGLALGEEPYWSFI